MFPRLANVNGSIIIDNIAALTSTTIEEAFPAVASVNGSTSIYDNAALTMTELGYAM